MTKLTHSFSIAAVLATLGAFGCTTEDSDDSAGGTDASGTATATATATTTAITTTTNEGAK